TSFHATAPRPIFKYRAILGGGIDWIESLSKGVSQIDLFSDEQDDLAWSLFSDTKQLPFDGEARAPLPQPRAEHAGIAGLAAFVGRGPNFEIWEPKAFEAHKAEARQRALE